MNDRANFGETRPPALKLRRDRAVVPGIDGTEAGRSLGGGWSARPVVHQATLAAVVMLALPPSGAAQSPAEVTFSKDIAPIVFDRCGECHRPNGAAPFSLLTYEAVKQRATQIAQVTKNRFMPPWKAEPESGEFIGQRHLTSAEIDLIQRWVDQGTLEGDPRQLPDPPRHTEGWQLGTPDLVITFPERYTLQADGSDVFRVFAVPIPVDRARQIVGLEFRPGNPKVVHHANIRVDPTPASRKRDAEDPAPGYDGLLSRSAVYPEGHFLGWTPGQTAPLLPPELAWRMELGTDLVVQLHMQPSGKPEAVQPSVGLFFGSQSTQTSPTASTTVHGTSARTPSVIRLGSQDIGIEPGDASYTIRDSYVLPVDVDVHAVQPHAHYRAREIKGLATLPDGSTRWLIHITNWDFRWQHVYRYVAPFSLPKGTSLSMEYTYDNSEANARNPERPPMRVRWGQRSGDEMGDLWLQVLTRDARDRAILNREVQRKMVKEDAIGYETMIRAYPDDVELHNDVALLYLELARPDEAVRHFETTTKLSPGSAPAHFNLATALSVAGQIDKAIGSYRRALQIAPDYALAHNNLGTALLSEGTLDEAIDEFRAAIRADPQHALAHNNLGSLLIDRNPDEAHAHLREALGIDPKYPEAHYNMGRLSREQGALAEAVSHFRQAVNLKPDWAPALADLAWLLATAPTEELRNPDQAVQFAERAAALTGQRDARVLDVLAAAYAATGLFDRAVAAADAALGLAPPEALASDIRERRELYLQHQPYRMPDPGLGRNHP